MKNRQKRAKPFAICIDNRGYPASLEVGKLYQTIPDEESSKHGYIRVVDESGEDYGYSADRFFVMQIPEPVARILSPRSRKVTPRYHGVTHPARLRTRRG